MSSISSSVVSAPQVAVAQAEVQQEQRTRESVVQSEVNRQPQIESADTASSAQETAPVEDTAVVQEAYQAEVAANLPQPETFSRDGSIESAKFGDISVRA